jgi:hypothetical protein
MYSESMNSTNSIDSLPKGSLRRNFNESLSLSADLLQSSIRNLSFLSTSQSCEMDSDELHSTLLNKLTETTTSSIDSGHSLHFDNSQDSLFSNPSIDPSQPVISTLFKDPPSFEVHCSQEIQFAQAELSPLPNLESLKAIESVAGASGSCTDTKILQDLLASPADIRALRIPLIYQHLGFINRLSIIILTKCPEWLQVIEMQLMLVMNV